MSEYEGKVREVIPAFDPTQLAFILETEGKQHDRIRVLLQIRDNGDRIFPIEMRRKSNYPGMVEPIWHRQHIEADEQEIIDALASEILRYRGRL
jgi:hypothetical protein